MGGRGVVSGAAKCYVCRALGPGDLRLPGRRPLGKARGEPAAVGRAGQPPLPPEGATGQPDGPDRAASGGGDDGRRVEGRATSTTEATSDS